MTIKAGARRFDIEAVVQLAGTARNLDTVVHFFDEELEKIAAGVGAAAGEGVEKLLQALRGRGAARAAAKVKTPNPSNRAALEQALDKVRQQGSTSAYNATPAGHIERPTGATPTGFQTPMMAPPREGPPARSALPTMAPDTTQRISPPLGASPALSTPAPSLRAPAPAPAPQPASAVHATPPPTPPPVVPPPVAPAPAPGRVATISQTPVAPRPAPVASASAAGTQGPAQVAVPKTPPPSPTPGPSTLAPPTPSIRPPEGGLPRPTNPQAVPPPAPPPLPPPAPTGPAYAPAPTSGPVHGPAPLGATATPAATGAMADLKTEAQALLSGNRVGEQRVLNTSGGSVEQAGNATPSKKAPKGPSTQGRPAPPVPKPVPTTAAPGTPSPFIDQAKAQAMMGQKWFQDLPPERKQQILMAAGMAGTGALGLGAGVVGSSLMN